MDRSHYKRFSFDEPWVSKSDIKLYKRCPYAWYLRKIEGLEPEVPEAMSRGTDFHDWAETIYDKIDGKAILNGDITVYEEMMKYAPPGQIYENFAEMEQRRYERDPTERFFPVKTEEFLYDEDLLFMGTYDRLDKEGEDEYVVVDYKTGQYKDYKLSDWRFELYGYKYLIEQNYNFDVNYMCVIVPDSKKYVFEEFKSATQKAFFRKIKDVREGILNKVFPANGHCPYCFMAHSCAERAEQVK